MAAHRFRQYVESINSEPTLGAFVPCPGALLQFLTPAQQTMAYQIYQLARPSWDTSRVEAEPSWLIDFSMN
jgi:hypothetical protein